METKALAVSSTGGRLRDVWNDVRARFWSSEPLVMLTLSALVGVGAGFGTLFLIWLIDLFTRLFFGWGETALSPFLGRTYVILIPALGGLLVGPIVHFVAPEAKGHGVPEVMAAIVTAGGKIRPVVVVAKAVGSALTIGSGGSVGREGPIVQIGSALGSTIGQIFHLSERRIVTLIAAGAAAGIAATFNAPIAGVLFAIEVILGELTATAFGTIVLAAVAASVVSQAFLGNYPAFVVPPYSLVSPWELVLYLGLGLICALVAQTFVWILYWLEDLFDEWRFPPYLKPAVGGLALGVVGFLLPQTFGTGFPAIEKALLGEFPWRFLLLLVVGKIAASSLTLGSGASGGIFAPTLFLGAMAGGAYGQLVHTLWPQSTAQSGAYAMVGMAAVFAGAARAPITGILILFEMTRDYRIILPLMFATVVSTLVARALEKESIYTLKLVRKGIDVHARADRDLMRTIRVEEAMTPVDQVPTVSPDLPIDRLAELFQKTHHHGFPVLDEKGELCGIVTMTDLERALAQGKAQATVGEICTTQVITVYPDETLEDAARYFALHDLGRIPVVDRRNPRRLVGMLWRGDIVRAYARALVDWQTRQRYMDRLRLEQETRAHMIEVELSPRHGAIGKRIRDLSLPPNTVIVSIRRGHKVLAPRGDTRLLVGDELVIHTTPEEAPLVERILLLGGPVEEEA